MNPVVLKGLIDELTVLGNLLGRAHDLSFLAERLRVEKKSGDQQRQAEKLLDLIDTTQSDLQRGAAELADRFFAERPRDFGSRVAGWLDDWKRTGSPAMTKQLVGK